MGRNVIVGPHKDGGWQPKKAGAERASRRTETQGAAIAAGRGFAKEERSELIIQRRNGQIRAKDSQGNDPRRTKG